MDEPHNKLQLDGSHLPGRTRDYEEDLCDVIRDILVAEYKKHLFWTFALRISALRVWQNFLGFLLGKDLGSNTHN